jgi:O-antigen ligase
MMVFLYVVFLASVLAAFFKGPNYLLFAAALLLPMTQVMPSPIGIISVPVNLLLIGLMSSRSQHVENRHEKLRLPLRGPVAAIIAVLLLGLLIRGAGELNGGWFEIPFYEVARIVWYWVTPLVLYVLVFARARVLDDAALRTIVTLCQVSVAGESLLSLWERVNGIGRATAHIGEANRAGAYFGSAAAFFLAWFLMERTSRRWGYLLAWGLAVGGVFNSLSRGAMLATAITSTFIGLTFFATARRSTGTKLAFSLMIVLLVANFSLIVPQRVVDRVLFTFGGERPQNDDEVKVDASSGERLLFWRLAWELFKERPYGYGATTFPQLNAAADGIPKQAHNIYLQFLVEQGLQGFVVLLVLVVTVGVSLWRRYRRSSDEYTQALALSLLGWWVAHAIAHFFVNPFFNVQIIGQFWMMFACLAVLSARETRERADPGVRDAIPARSRFGPPRGPQPARNALLEGRTPESRGSRVLS